MQEESIFLKAIECERGPQRDALLKKECAGDTRLQENIEKLLEAHENQDMFFERTVSASPASENAQGFSEGTQVGEFEIISELGRGGMGVVYRATQKSLNRPVALKILPSCIGLNQRSIVRFRREAEAAARLHHTNIVPIYSTGECNGTYYYAMEVINGPSLDRVLNAMRGANDLEPGKELPDWVVDVMGVPFGAEKRKHTSDPKSSSSQSVVGEVYFDKVAKMIAGVAHALQHAHEQGVIHRDIKPANLLLSSDGRLSINDFGLARDFDQASLTLSGEFVGTPRYMSPEQITAGRVPLDHRTDVYSLGAALYELLTFQPPFPGNNRDEVVAQILQKEPRRPQRLNPKVPRDLETICLKALERDPERRFPSAKDFADDLERFLNRYTIRARRSGIIGRSWKFVKRNRMLCASTCSVTFAIVIAVFFVLRAAGIKEKAKQQEYARIVVLPEIRNLIASGDYSTAFDKAKSIEEIIRGDPELSSVLRDVVVTMSVDSQPPGAQVFLMTPGDINDVGRGLGVTPIEHIQLPRGCFLWRFSKSGYDVTNFIRNTEKDGAIRIELVPNGVTRGEMVRISGGKSPVAETYFIDKLEVSNKEFQEFVDDGGYDNSAFWNALIDEQGDELWRSTVATFKDQTNHQGPANWKNGRFPAREGKMPVRGICWYEAAAYAEYAGKSLPTIYHWQQATDQFNNAFATIPFSNIGGKHAGPVDYAAGMSTFGAYHMAGNVREWCWNSAGSNRRYQLGGCWKDSNYLYSELESADSLSRSSYTGFRCMWHPPGIQLKNAALAAKTESTFKIPVSRPVSDEVFESWRGIWAYSKEGLNLKVVEEHREQYWIERVLEYGQPRSEGRMRAHLFLPSGSEPPFQTIIFFPGGSANNSDLRFGAKKDLNWLRLNFLLRSGRAVCCPIYSGTYERMGEMTRFSSDPHGHVDWSNRVLREVSRTIDALETQDDIDADRLAYVGTSWGGSMGPRILATEPRIKAGVFALGGLYRSGGPPQTNDVNFLPRITVPVLMLNGRYDLGNPKEEVNFVFENIGTDRENKQLQFFETGHAVPVEQLLEWTDTWLDKYLGPHE